MLSWPPNEAGPLSAVAVYLAYRDPFDLRNAIREPQQ
jgi:hypothetical protein